MNKLTLHWLDWVAVGFLITSSAWAADSQAAKEVPAILANLDSEQVIILDDQAAAAIRGQESQYQYVLVKILGINALDWGPGVNWTWNPLGYRYGAFGGPGWSNSDCNPADDMDGLFKTHDEAYSGPNADKLAADVKLLAGLKGLVNQWSWWGPIYVASPKGLESPIVYVSAVSFFGNKLFFGWKSMPYTEYARRQALAALGIMVLGRSLTSFIKLQ